MHFHSYRLRAARDPQAGGLEGASMRGWPRQPGGPGELADSLCDIRGVNHRHRGLDGLRRLEFSDTCLIRPGGSDTFYV